MVESFSLLRRRRLVLVFALALSLATSACSGNKTTGTKSESPADSQAKPAGRKIPKACDLVPKDDLEKAIGQPLEVVDEPSLVEDPAGCKYVIIHDGGFEKRIRVLIGSDGEDFERAKEGGESVEGLGEEAYVPAGEYGYGSINVKVRENLFLSLGADPDGGAGFFEKDQAIKTAKLFIAKL